MRINFNNTYMYLLLPFTLLIFELINIRYVFPITEGWWEVYAWLNSTTNSLYEEAGLKFPPLFVLIIQFLSINLNLTIFETRIIFVIVKLITIIFTYYWLRKYFDRNSSLIGSAIPSFLIYANPVYLTKDYHSIVALLVSAILLLISRSIAKDNVNKLILFIIGFVAGILLLTKQNVGLFLSVGILVYYLKTYVDLNIIKSKTAAFDFLIGLIGFITPILVIGYLVPDWYSIFSQNDSKGSYFTVIFRFLLDKSIAFQILLALLIIAIAAIIFKNKIFRSFYVLNIDLIQVCFFIISLALIPLSIISSIPFVAISLAWPVVYCMLINEFGKLEQSTKNIWIVLFAYAYCGTNTAGFNFVSIDYLIAFYFASTFYLLGQTKYKIYLNKFYSPLFILLLMFFYVFVVKFSSGNGYNWWGLKAGGLFESTEKIDHPLLKNIYTDPKTAEMLNVALQNDSLMSHDEKIFSYPSIPILYLLTNKLPGGAPVLWFDVSGNVEAKKTLKILEKQNPRFIYWLRPPDYVYNGHFNLRKQDPGMVIVDDWLINALKSNKYQIKKMIPSFDINHKYITKKFNASLSMNFIYHFDNNGHSDLCIKIKGCSQNFNLYSFSSGTGYEEFIRESLALLVSSDYIFYVLERNPL